MNNKNKKIVLIIILAVIVGIIGGVFLYLYLKPQKTTIYVFKENVSAGEVVTIDMLVAVQADSDIFVAGAQTNASDRFVTGENIEQILKSGDNLRMDVTAGMPLTLSLLTTNGGSSIEINMNPEKIAITVPANNITGVTYDLKTGSRVNVYFTGIISNGAPSTILLFENMRVLGTTLNNGSLNSVTLETTIEESLKLIYYTSSGSIYFGLIDSSGYEYANTQTPSFSPTSTDNYIDYYDEYIEPNAVDETSSSQNTTETPISEPVQPEKTEEQKNLISE